jgi:hypothetical protein
VKKGERLEVLGREGEWVRVRLADGATGWVHGKYVQSDEPCTPDKATADLLSGVPLSFTEGQSVGTVVLEATVDATGTVVSTKVVRDTTRSDWCSAPKRARPEVLSAGATPAGAVRLHLHPQLLTVREGGDATAAGAALQAGR